MVCVAATKPLHRQRHDNEYYEGSHHGYGHRDRNTGYGFSGQRVGIIKEIRSYDLLLDRPLARDVYVPISTIRIGQDGP